MSTTTEINVEGVKTSYDVAATQGNVPYTWKQIEEIIRRMQTGLVVLPVVGGSWGDEGKGKIIDEVIKFLQKIGLPILAVLRTTGGHNAGNTAIVEGKKVVGHLLAPAIARGIMCLIGPDCIVDPRKVTQEVEGMRAQGFPDPEKLVCIAPQCALISKRHIAEDSQRSARTGSTGTGSAQVRADRAQYQADTVGENYTDGYMNGCKIMRPWEYLEGKTGIVLATVPHGFNLRLNGPFYPNVTACDPTIQSILSCDVPIRSIFTTTVCFKAYDTAVGVHIKFYQKYLTEEDYTVFKAMSDIGGERGATTGRERKSNWWNMDLAIAAIRVNQGIDGAVVIVNKCDIFQRVCEQFGLFKVHHGGKLVSFNSYDEMEGYVRNTMMTLPYVKHVVFSRSASAL